MKQSKAVVQHRRKELLRLLETKSNLNVLETSQLLNVSPITIRRDMQALENMDLLQRYHGGAKPVTNEESAPPQFAYRGQLQMQQKRLIAKVVSEMVMEKQTVFLNAGSTTLSVIERLLKKPVRIITNNAQAISLWDGSSKAELILTGGEYYDRNRSFLGNLATQLLSKVYADLCVLGVNGIHSNSGVTTYTYQETLLNELMITRCNGKRIVAADGTKVGHVYCFPSTAIENIDILVTDSSADPEELAAIAECGVEIILADQELN